jgi:hypothetical protein
MKTMSCRQLGGACDEPFSANTFDEIAAISQQHGKEMHEKQDKAHLEAMQAMGELMSEPDKMQAWFAVKKQEFESLQDD